MLRNEKIRHALKLRERRPPTPVPDLEIFQIGRQRVQALVEALTKDDVDERGRENRDRRLEIIAEADVRERAREGVRGVREFAHAV